MQDACITFRSVTWAQRGEGLLRRQGIRCRLSRAPGWMEEQGCGYALMVAAEDLAQSVRLLRQNRIPLRRAYRPGPEGSMEEAEV